MMEYFEVFIVFFVSTLGMIIPLALLTWFVFWVVDRY